MTSILSTALESLKPGTVSKDIYEQNEYYTISQKRLARIVGAIAALLPTVTLVTGLTGYVCFYDSLSHFYYSRFLGDVFVGSLIFIGVFLIAYSGEDKIENRLATLAGFCAMFVAVFPTAFRGCEDPDFAGRAFMFMKVSDAGKAVKFVLPSDEEAVLGHAFQLFPWSAVVHYASATLLFAFLAWYAFKVFPRKIEEVDAGNAKIRRNRIYYACGTVIVLSMIALGAYGLFGDAWPWWNDYNLTFWCEAFALWAFGLSWMVKGRLWNWSWLVDPHEAAAKASSKIYGSNATA